MHYVGGKFHLSKLIAEAIEYYRRDRPYLEPFVGGGHILERVPHEHGRYAGDGNKALINLYKAVQKGWVPPGRLSKDDWRRLKRIQDPRDPMTAFAGIGCSYMGMWFSNPATQLAGTAKRALLRQKPLFEGTTFSGGSYAEWDPKSTMIYCDPPYANTLPYPAAPDFDHGEFWRTLERWAKRGNTILVSEYTAPPGVECIARWETTGSLKRGGSALEKLFLLGA
jgi:DNA adenine methylase